MVKPSDLRKMGDQRRNKREGRRPRHAKNQPLKGDKGLFALKNKLEKETKE